MSGVASCRCVRPILTMSGERVAPCRRACRAARRPPAAGGARPASAAAMCIAVGNVSFDDWPRLTWSFGWTGFLLPIVAAGQLDRAVRDHLVRVHVRLRAAAGLPDEQGKVIVERAVDHLVGRARRSARRSGCGSVPSSPLVSAAAFFRMPSARISGRGEVLVADVEVVQRPLGLRAPVPVGGDRDLAHAVGFCACLGMASSQLKPRPMSGVSTLNLH